MAYAVYVSGVTLLNCLADWQNNFHAIDGENPTDKIREKQQKVADDHAGVLFTILQNFNTSYVKVAAR